MRSIVLITLASLLLGIVHAEWQPSIHGTPSPAFISSDSSGNRIMVNMYNKAGIWLTNDSGLNWTQINDRITEEPVILQVPFCDFVSVGAAADTMIINIHHGDGQSMPSQQFHTLDGGITWSSFQDIVTEFWPDSIENMIFWDPAIVLSDRIYYSREDGFAISYDDGQTWDVIDVGPLHQGLNGATFDEHDPDVIFMYGSWSPVEGGVIGSYDGGWTWSLLTDMVDLTGVDDGFITDLCRGHDDHVYAATAWSAGYFPYSPFLHSSDLGATWESLGSEGFPAGMNTMQIQAVPEVPGRLLTGGHWETGVWESEDGGQTWHRLLRGLPERPTPIETFYRNPHSGHIYICLINMGLWRSTDFGETWHQVPSPPIGISIDSYYDLALIAAEGGVLNGYRGTGLFYAIDDATVFQPIPEFGNHQDLEAWRYPVNFTDEMLLTSVRTRDLWTLEREQIIVYSEDDGSSWEQIDCGFEGAFNLTSVETDLGLVLVGCADGASVDVSFDLGVTWQHHDLDFTFPYSLMTAGTDLYTVPYGDQADLMRSSDFGETWEGLGFPEPDDFYGMVSPILAIGDTLLVRAGESCWSYLPIGELGGIWQQRGEIHSHIGTVFFDWDVVSTPADTFLVGSSRIFTVLFTSHDNGWTWEEQYLEMPGFYQGEVVTELEYDPWRDRLWLNTNMGLMYLDHPTTAVGEDVWVFQPATYTTLTAYPNPFNSATTVRYSLTRPGDVRVRVFDLLGREVATLHDGLSMPGDHMLMFDASALSSGTYFLQLDTNEQTHTRKLMLVK